MSSHTVCVTGAAGFIGSNLVDRFLADGWRVVGLDNFDPFYSRKIKEQNLKGALDHPEFEFQEMDLNQAHLLNALLETTKPDVVIHLAAKAGVRPSLDDPAAYARSNYEATVVLLEAMRQAGCRRLVFGSSSSVYGESEKQLLTEDQCLSQPISPYAATKLGGELLAYVYHHAYGFSIAALRFFTVYGPRQRPDLAIHKFARLMSQDRPITLYGDGSSMRDYTYVSDTVSGIIAAANRLLTQDEPDFETFNLGISDPTTLAELVQLIADAFKIKPDILFTERQMGDVFSTHADISRAKAILGYQPTMKIDEGIAKFASWFLENQEFLLDTDSSQ